MWEWIFVFIKLDRAAILHDPVMDRGLFSYWQAWDMGSKFQPIWATAAIFDMFLVKFYKIAIFYQNLWEIVLKSQTLISDNFQTQLNFDILRKASFPM